MTTWSEATPPPVVVYISPQPRCDVVPYIFYRETGRSHVLDVRHQSLPDYKANRGNAILRALDASAVRDDATVRITLGGSAYSVGFTWEQLSDELASASDRTGIRVDTDMVASVGHLRAVNGSVVVAHRLAGVSTNDIERFLESAGINCAGVVSVPQSATSNAVTPLQAGSRQVAELCASAMRSYPDAAAVLLLGGSYLPYEAQALVESSGRTFVNNTLAFAAEFAQPNTNFSAPSAVDALNKRTFT